MATTYSYGYTVECYINWDDAYATDPNAVKVGSPDFQPDLYPKLIQMTSESLTGKATKFEVQIGFGVTWLVRLYQIKNVNGAKTYYWLNGHDVGTGLTADFGGYGSYIKGGPKLGAHTFSGVSHINPVNASSNGAVYNFSTYFTQGNNTLTNPFSLTCNFRPSDFGDTYGGDTSTTPVTSLSLLGISPTIVIGAAVPIPPFPTGFQQYITHTNLFSQGGSASITTGNSGGSISIIFDKCTKKWFGMLVSTLVYSKAGKAVYGLGTYECDAAGNSQSFKTLSTKLDIPQNYVDPKTKKTPVQTVQDQMHTIVLADCLGVKTGQAAGPSKPAVASPPPGFDTNKDRWNPPPHVSSRTTPYLPPDGLYGTDGQPISALQQDLKYIIGSSTTFGNQGKIYQDPQGAATLNTNIDNISKYAVGKGQTAMQWGFRFMYNPTTFSYNTSSNNNVDWTLGSSDPTVLLQGNQSVTFELYLNRIIDLTYLKNYPSGGPDTAGAYVDGGLSEEAAQGLLNRGTEYDIEFLYRVLNGDPLKNSLLLGDSYRAKGYTADFGYTTATPCWLALNDNLRYFGSVASMQVNHMIFDLRMVPVLSVVTITFSRYPALWSDPAATKNSGYGSASDFVKALGNSLTTSTGTTPGATPTK